MGCTKYSVQCYWDPDTGEPIPPCCHKHLLEIVEYITNLFDRENIVYWADYGTLLGAIREKGIIAWDSDIDLGILSFDLDKFLSLKDEIEKDGFYLEIYEEKNLYQIWYSKKNVVFCDLWVNYITTIDKHIPIDDVVKNYFPIISNEKICQSYGPGRQDGYTYDFPLWFIEDRDYADLNGLSIRVPRQPEKFLRMRYGNWKKPKKKGKDYWTGNSITLDDMINYVEKMRSKD